VCDRLPARRQTNQRDSANIQLYLDAFLRMTALFFVAAQHRIAAFFAFF
jgi:hypothetical protein